MITSPCMSSSVLTASIFNAKGSGSTTIAGGVTCRGMRRESLQGCSVIPALVGIGSAGRQTPVLCVEPLHRPNAARRHRIRTDLLQLGAGHAVSKSVRHILFHKSFPVDIRHNAKIGREKLAAWAAEKLA